MQFSFRRLSEKFKKKISYFDNNFWMVLYENSEKGESFPNGFPNVSIHDTFSIRFA